MRTLHCQLYVVTNISFLKVKNRQLTTFECSQRYSTPDTMIFRHEFQTIFGHQNREWF